MTNNTGQRFAGSWAKTRNSVLLTVAAIEIIGAAELEYALHYIQKLEVEPADTGPMTDKTLN